MSCYPVLVWSKYYSYLRSNWLSWSEIGGRSPQRLEKWRGVEVGVSDGGLLKSGSYHVSCYQPPFRRSLQTSSINLKHRTPIQASTTQVGRYQRTLSRSQHLYFRGQAMRCLAARRVFTKIGIFEIWRSLGGIVKRGAENCFLSFPSRVQSPSANALPSDRVVS